MSDVSVAASDSFTSVSSTARTASLPSLEDPAEVEPVNTDIESLPQSNGIKLIQDKGNSISPTQNYSDSSTSNNHLNEIEKKESTNTATVDNSVQSDSAAKAMDEGETNNISSNGATSSSSTSSSSRSNTLPSSNSNESALSSPSASNNVLISLCPSSSPTLPSDSELTKLLTAAFLSVDPTVATAKSIREQLEAKLGISLHEKKKFISDTLKRLVNESEDGTLEETQPKEKKRKVESNTKKTKKKHEEQKEDEDERGGSNKSRNNGRKEESMEEEEEQEDEEKQEEDQEERDRRLALDLQEELSGGRPRRSAAADAIARSNKRKQKFDAAAEGSAAKKLKPKKPPKLMSLSPALADFFDGTDRMSRGDVVRKMWDYIKANSLQDPSDKRKILLDDRMKGVFGASKKSVTMFSMNKFLTKHIFRPEDVE